MNITDKCFKGFFFDLDGTVLDTTELIRQSFRYASREVLGEELPDEVLMANVGQPLDKQMKLLDEERAQELYDTYRVFNHASHGEYIREYEGMEELLVTLRERGARLGIVTSKSRRVVDMALEHIPIEHHFDIMVTTDDTENHKPHPQPLQFAMRQLDLTPEESVYIGDSPFDIKAGQAAGMATVAVSWGIFPPVQLRELEPDFFFDRPDEILQLCPA